VANLICEYRDTTLSCREDRWRTARKSRRISTNGSHSSRSTRRVICLVSFITFSLQLLVLRSFVFVVFVNFGSSFHFFLFSSSWLRLSNSWSLAVFPPSSLVASALHTSYRILSTSEFSTIIIYASVEPTRAPQRTLQNHKLTYFSQSGQPGTRRPSHTRKQVQLA
jgi:hypothetical protein